MTYRKSNIIFRFSQAGHRDTQGNKKVIKEQFIRLVTSFLKKTKGLSNLRFSNGCYVFSKEQIGLTIILLRIIKCDIRMLGHVTWVFRVTKGIPEFIN